MPWARLLAYVTGTVNQELLLRNEYLAAENRILRGQIRSRLLLSDGEKVTLAEIAHRLGRMALEDVAATAKPDTILGWYRKLIAKKVDGAAGDWPTINTYIKDAGNPSQAQDLPGLIYHQRAQSNEFLLRAVTGTSFLTIRHKVVGFTDEVHARDLPPPAPPAPKP